MGAGAVRPYWPLAIGVLLGVICGVAVSVSRSASYKAEASVLISSPAGVAVVRPQLPNLRELATSGVVAGNVRSTLRLPQSTQDLRGQIDASIRPQSEVIAVSAKDDNADHARQLAQEVAVVFGQLVDARFGTGQPELHAAVLDSAHAVGGPERHYLRNGLIGALVGTMLGASAMLVLSSQRPRAATSSVDESGGLKEREEMLVRRIDGVVARERALAQRAGELAARQHELDERKAQLEVGERELKVRVEEIGATQEQERRARAAAPAPAPAPAPPEPESMPESSTVVRRAGRWNIDVLQRAVDDYGPVSAERAEEWRTYLFFLREHAAADGSLPRQFDGLIADVFGALEGSG